MHSHPLEERLHQTPAQLREMIHLIARSTGHSVRRICESLQVPRSSYYHAAAPTESQRSDARMSQAISTIFHHHRRRYGYRRIWKQLAADGITCPRPEGAFYVYPDIAGVIGSLVVIVAYFATQAGWLSAGDPRFAWANLAGAALIMLSLMAAWNWEANEIHWHSFADLVRSQTAPASVAR